jgi:hypothetical protein
MSAREMTGEPSAKALISADLAYDDMDGICGSDDVKVLARYMDRFAADMAREFIRDADGTEDAGEADAGFFVCLGLLAEHFGVEAPAYRPERRDRVREAVERCCAAVCEECAEGKKPKRLDDYGGMVMHLFQGFPPRECKAAKIRDALKE